MTIQELREKRSKAWDTARDFLDSKRNESGLLSEEDSKTYDAMEQQIVAYGKEIQRLERQAQIEAEMNKPTSTPIQDKPNQPFTAIPRQGLHLMHIVLLSGTAFATAIFTMSETTCRLVQILRAAILCRLNLNGSW